MCKAPPAAPFSGGNTSAEALVSMSSAKATSPASVQTRLNFMIRMQEQGYTRCWIVFKSMDVVRQPAESDNEVQQLTPYSMPISVKCPRGQRSALSNWHPKR
jgi:hypothetical protein